MRGQISGGAAAINNDTNLSLVIDLSEYHETPTLLIRCHGCRQMFQSDYEERWCAACVQRRELVTMPAARSGGR